MITDQTHLIKEKRTKVLVLGPNTSSLIRLLARTPRPTRTLTSNKADWPPSTLNAFQEGNAEAIAECQVKHVVGEAAENGGGIAAPQRAEALLGTQSPETVDDAAVIGRMGPEGNSSGDRGGRSGGSAILELNEKMGRVSGGGDQGCERILISG